jgi:polar amino acid transport system substrate-binding protein
MGIRGGRIRFALVVSLAALAATACTRVEVPKSLPGPTTSTTAELVSGPTAPDCGNPVASLRPTGPSGVVVPAATYMSELRQKGTMRVGVSVDTLLFGSVDPFTGQFVGFDNDIAREVAARLFGVPFEKADSHITWVAIPYSERVNALATGRVDLVADTFTINCRRRETIEFSSEYFTSAQRVLVRSDSQAQRLEDLHAQKVCAAAGSTSIENIMNAVSTVGDPTKFLPDITPVVDQADCLVALQQGKVAAISTDDTILAGMAAQDPNVRIVGPPISSEPYGLGLPKGHDPWVRYVNGVLEELRRNGRWGQIYQRWLSKLGPTPAPPQAVYRG